MHVQKGATSNGNAHLKCKYYSPYFLAGQTSIAKMTRTLRPILLLINIGWEREKIVLDITGSW